jgi:hypothetical protein
MKNHMVRHMNWLTAVHSDRFVFSSRESAAVEDRDHDRSTIHESQLQASSEISVPE